MRRALLLLLLLSVLLAPPVRAEQEAGQVYRRGTVAGKVAISFDDGPHPRYTEEILDLLAQYDARATFFVIGENARAHPELLRRAVREGHEIGNHTDTHVFMRDMTLARLCQEVTAASDSIEQIVGTRPRLFRPPGGSYNDRGVRALCEMGYTCVLWSKDTRDWSCPPVQSVVERALSGISGGDIILMHDFCGPESPTPEALRQILPALTELGYRIVPVSEVLSP